MLSRRLFLNICRKFSTTPPPPPNQPSKKQTPQSQLLAQAQKQQSLRIPVHLRPYDRFKYEVPTKNIKKNSGYAMIQIQPFPRARIMKICYNILTEVRKDIPEDFTFRILLQEKTKYIMDLVDKVQDPQILEQLLGRVPIQIFTRNLADLLQVITVVRQMKPWNDPQADIQDLEGDFQSNFGFVADQKYPKYQKSERKKQNIL